jgi:hypothetical protein
MIFVTPQSRLEKTKEEPLSSWKCFQQLDCSNADEADGFPQSEASRLMCSSKSCGFIVSDGSPYAVVELLNTVRILLDANFFQKSGNTTRQRKSETGLELVQLD